MAKVMADPRSQPSGQDMPFDGKRMIWGGFAPIVAIQIRRVIAGQVTR